jgi:hypothetical protein
VCSGLDLTKYLAYLSLCTMSSHFPLFSPSLIRSDDLAPTRPTFLYLWQGPLLATLISFELVRTCSRATLSFGTKCHVMKVYISIPFSLITVSRCDASAELIYAKRTLMMTRFFLLFIIFQFIYCGFREKGTAATCVIMSV